MATTSASRVLVLALLALCAIAGGYGTMAAGFRNGFFKTLTDCLEDPAGPYIPGGPEPFKTRYTGVSAVDEHLVFLVAFFAAFIDGEKSWSALLAFWYLLAHFWAGWTLLSLEGLRKGNKGRSVSWTGTMGIIIQNISYTITVPVYLIVHVLTSPVAQSTPEPHLFSVDDLDLKLLPFCTLAAFVVPCIAMFLPSPSIIPGSAHYSMVAFWQAFPLWQSAFHWALKRMLSSRQTPKIQHSPIPTAAYKLVLFFTTLSQITFLATALIPASAVPDSWSSIFSSVADLTSAFVPASLLSPLNVQSNSSPIPPHALPPLALDFLQWDVYCGGMAVMLWALYLRRATVRRRERGGTRSGWVGILGKVLVWGILGGPVAVAAVLLWERDEVMKSELGKKSE